MAVEAVLLVILVSVSLGNTQREVLKLECQPGVGVVGQNTKISCSFKRNFETDHNIIITAGSVTKRGETDPVFWFQNDTVKGDHRFKSPSKNDPSLLLTDTAVSDEERYDYTVVTNRGFLEETFRIGVTAKYNQPTISTWPEKIEEGGTVELNCNASGGYPAGAIHWFDNTNTNWTKSATQEITEREDKLVHLSSKLTFAKTDSSWAPFRCVVLNSKFVQEGETTSRLKFTDDGHSGGTNFMRTSITAGLLVIGLIIVGLLLALLYCRRHVQKARRPSTEPMLRAFLGRTRQAEADADADIEADELQTIH